ncbi:MAG: DUF3301 domain-containing protein [Gammaproteobacteria bacterium]|nr:DUF3301 domain-containing protein [Gammaproteobacteria bacterium]
MILDLGEVVLILVLAAYAAYLFQALRVRELALQAARRSCEREGVQLLDQSVSIQRLSVSRDAGGKWRVWRQYRFEYTVDGQERERGNVIMLGNRLQALVMAEHTLH